MVQVANEGVTQIPIAVIIATSFRRTNLLLDRALKSVLNQSYSPKYVVIVDDNEEDNELHEIKTGLKKKFGKANDLTQIFLIRNKRTRNMSGTGAWNTGVDYISKMVTTFDLFYIAILDDDDEWEINYLEECWKCFNQNNSEITFAIFANLTRIEHEYTIPFELKREDLTVDKFLFGNPGVQGSNMIFSLSVYSELGGFDERLASTTDRDFMIRFLTTYSAENVILVNKNLVKHYVGNHTVTSMHDVKTNGLDVFYNKYIRQFSYESLANSLDRAEKLFNYPNRLKILELYKSQQ